MEPRAKWNRANSHVSKILPLTTFRTIDLGGKKNSTPLFSRFYAKTECFLRNFLHQKGCIAIGNCDCGPSPGGPAFSRIQTESGTFRTVLVLFPKIWWAYGEADFPSMLNWAYGPVAQRLEQQTHNLLVPGSNPGGPTNILRSRQSSTHSLIPHFSSHRLLLYPCASSVPLSECGLPNQRVN